MSKTREGILLVQPDFPLARKSINHHDYFPIGLLKIGSYYKNVREQPVKLVVGEKDKELIIPEIGYPEKILITSLFTYWATYFYEIVEYYITLFPKSEFYFGGIYVSLMTNSIRYKLKKRYPNIKFHLRRKLHKQAEKATLKFGPSIELLQNDKIDYLVLHAMRGCFRRCSFCGTWKIEDRDSWSANKLISYIEMVINKYTNINRLVFYDNNFLDNENIEDILKVLIELKNKRVIKNCISQSGFVCILLTPSIAILLKKAGFVYPKIAWDGSLKEAEDVLEQIRILSNVGYNRKKISVFMLYNWNINFNDMLEKLKICYKFGVQINDCRYRPVDSSKPDNYNPYTKKQQTNKDYFIHHSWKDWQIRLFRKLVRKCNIMTRQNWTNIQFEQWRKKKKIVKNKSNLKCTNFFENDIEKYLDKHTINNEF